MVRASRFELAAKGPRMYLRPAVTTTPALQFQTLHEIVRAARNNLAPGPWDYLIGGAETETTLRRNRQALDSIAFPPRGLRGGLKNDAPPTHRLDRDLCGGRRRDGGESLRRVQRPADAQLRLQPRTRSRRRGGRQLSHLPALRPRRRRL